MVDCKFTAVNANIYVCKSGAYPSVGHLAPTGKVIQMGRLWPPVKFIRD